NQQLNTSSNNIANAGTYGFKSSRANFSAMYAGSRATGTEIGSITQSMSLNGGVLNTGRALDVAVENGGWIAVQSADGSEAYTRNGALKLNENGMLQTQSGLMVQGDTGPMAIPPGVTVSIASDGTVGTISTDVPPGPSTVLGRIKLVNPPEQQLVRGDDGLFRLKDGTVAQADQAVKLTTGALEGSNVSPVDSMVSMIALARQFETQMSLLKNAENNAAKATQILALN
ncbi:MAG: flagellar basal body rod protein FlgF, partial [Janthinobacterium sp.]